MSASTSFPVSLARGTPLLGEVISWSCSGVTVTHPALLAALRDAGLDTSMARELAPKHAFTRAARKLSDQRIIRKIAEDVATVRFQFTSEHRSKNRIDYELETMLSLDKSTGKVSCDLPGLATLAQEHLDHAIDTRTGADVTRVIQKLFEQHADLFPVRPQGGAYFVAERHSRFVNRVQTLLGHINGQILRFPVPAGTSEGDRSVKESVASGLTALLEEYRQAVASFDTDTRKGTLERAADRIRTMKFKIESYAELLAEEKSRLERGLLEAQRELRAKVEALAESPVLA